MEKKKKTIQKHLLKYLLKKVRKILVKILKSAYNRPSKFM